MAEAKVSRHWPVDDGHALAFAPHPQSSTHRSPKRHITGITAGTHGVD